MKFSPKRSWQTFTLVLVVIGILALSLGGYLSPLTSGLLNPIEPVQRWFLTRFQAFQDFFNAPTNLIELQQRNIELEAEVARLQTQIINLQQEVTEVEILSALLDFARAQPANEYQAAAVIGRDPSPFLQYVIINRGSDDGLRRGMPVVSNEGLVGRIAAVTANAARVQLITDPGVFVNVSIEPSTADAIMTGSITSDLNLDLIPQDASVAPGDLVLTSGIGGNYPANILVGQVTSIRREATSLFQTARLDPVSNFSRLEIVLVIVNFRPINITPLLPED